MEPPFPYLPSMQFCVKLFDIYTPGRNLHMCIDFETRIERAPILVLQFDCVVMGSDGLSHQKPTESGMMVIEGGGQQGGGGGLGSQSRNWTKKASEAAVIIPEHMIRNESIVRDKETSILYANP